MTGTVAKWTTFPATLPVTTPVPLNVIACATDADTMTLDSQVGTSGNAGTTGTGTGINYLLSITAASLVANSWTAACPTVPRSGSTPH